ncbi:hypothetical protein FBZ83_12920 [Azospirillum brasilense]|uniref:Uncharacterized protein n=1 Tax=Azospirillum brasilense TaxID=192 RepID=A0A560BM74_AZOBR|nr:hypothetical protein FBZ83_12920 [Azospirillum brasilense]
MRAAADMIGLIADEPDLVEKISYLSRDELIGL